MSICLEVELGGNIQQYVIGDPHQPVGVTERVGHRYTTKERV
jgi:hypothetical protein